jgi:hypothetical protein
MPNMHTSLLPACNLYSTPLFHTPCSQVLYSGVPLGLINHARRRKVSPPNFAFFQGKLNLHIPYEYSFGIRQGLYKAHRNTPRIVVKEVTDEEQHKPPPPLPSPRASSLTSPGP